jgi:hypothetical protein
MEIRERPSPIMEMLMAGPLGGTDKDLGAPTNYVDDVDSGPPRRCYQRHGSAHHVCRRRRWRGPWETLTGT